MAATYEDAITALRAADEAGNVEDARQLAQIAARLKPQTQEKVTPTVSFGPESFRKSLMEAAEADASPFGAKAVAGVGAMFDQASLRLKQAVGLTPEETQRVQANREILSTGPGLVGGAAGALMSLGAPIAAGTRAVASALPALGRAAVPAAAGVVGAATSASTNPVLPGESEGANAALGAAGALGGDLIARGLSRVAAPLRQSGPVKALLGEGVTPTPGQATGTGSFLGRVEEKLQSVPLVGDVIGHGRGRAVEEFNKAALNRAMPPGQQVKQAGRAGLEEADQALSGAYDKLFSGKFVTPDGALTNAVNMARNAPTLPLSDVHEQLFDKTLKKLVFDRIPQGGGSLEASALKREIIGDLGKVARQHLGSSTAAENALGEAFMAARNAVQGWLSQSVAAGNPGVSQQIAAIDRAYANKVALERAVEKAKGAPGAVFRPNQVQTSTKSGQPLRQFANEAQEVLGGRVPNSGTVDRAGLALLLGSGAGAGANEYFGGPGYLTALGLAPLLYSRGGSRYLIGDLPGQQAVSRGLESLLPLTTQAGRIGAQ